MSAHTHTHTHSRTHTHTHTHAETHTHLHTHIRTNTRTLAHSVPVSVFAAEPPKPSPAKEFSRLMEKVTFVLSGFQNPYRGDLRDKAVEMGAVYKPDWGKGCTHLM